MPVKKKIIYFFSVCFFIAILSIPFFSKELFQIPKLDDHYPVIHYQGHKKTSKITLHKKEPPYWTPLYKVSHVALAAIIMSEDAAFYEHPGYDLEQIKKAIEINWKKGRYVRGASTITQQTIKNIFLNKNKSLIRKLKELLLSIYMEKNLSKKRILELYINIAEWGERKDGTPIFGIHRASHYYFSKDPQSLTAKEGAFLAALLPSPKRYHRLWQSQALTNFVEERIDSILQQMTQVNMLSIEEYAREKTQPLWIN